MSSYKVGMLAEFFSKGKKTKKSEPETEGQKRVRELLADAVARNARLRKSETDEPVKNSVVQQEDPQQTHKIKKRKREKSSSVDSGKKFKKLMEDVTQRKLDEIAAKRGATAQTISVKMHKTLSKKGQSVKQEHREAKSPVLESVDQTDSGKPFRLNAVNGSIPSSDGAEKPRKSRTKKKNMSTENLSDDFSTTDTTALKRKSVLSEAVESVNATTENDGTAVQSSKKKKKSKHKASDGALSSTDTLAFAANNISETNHVSVVTIESDMEVEENIPRKKDQKKKKHAIEKNLHSSLMSSEEINGSRDSGDLHPITGKKHNNKKKWMDASKTHVIGSADPVIMDRDSDCETVNKSKKKRKEKMKNECIATECAQVEENMQNAQDEAPVFAKPFKKSPKKKLSKHSHPYGAAQAVSNEVILPSAEKYESSEASEAAVQKKEQALAEVKSKKNAMKERHGQLEVISSNVQLGQKSFKKKKKNLGKTELVTPKTTEADGESSHKEVVVGGKKKKRCTKVKTGQAEVGSHVLSSDSIQENSRRRKKTAASSDLCKQSGVQGVPPLDVYSDKDSVANEADDFHTTGPLNSKTLIRSQPEFQRKTSNVRDDPEKLKRTLFFGNIPLGMDKVAVKNVFGKYGVIESIRFRSVIPVKPSLPKKIAAHRNECHENVKSHRGFVVFETAEQAEKALELNGTLVNGNHIRVDRTFSHKQQHDNKHSVFIGNLPFDIDDESVWSAFSKCGKISYTRIIRDRETGEGKGFGFVAFQDSESIAAALELNGTEIAGRRIRVHRIKEVGKQAKKAPHGAQKSISRQGRHCIRLARTSISPIHGHKTHKKLLKKKIMQRQKEKIASVFKNVQMKKQS